MYLAIDVGATKTLLAVFSRDGKVTCEHKFATDHSYSKFKKDLQATISSEELKNFSISAACCAIPGKVDRAKGLGVAFGNLEWHNVPILADLEKILPHVPVLIENDANLAGLYEAHVHKKYKKVLYVTLSTGIGGGIITNGELDEDFADAEIGHMVLERDGQLKKWEDFASGQALVERFEQTAEQLNNPFAWKKYARDVARGLDALLATLQPDVIIIGGSVGAHLEKFQQLLEAELKKFANDMVEIPPIIKATKAEEAVIYGCYEFIRQRIH